MANIKLTELSELITANNQNTIFYVADLSVSPNISHYIRLGHFTSDNGIAYIAYAEANNALIKANTALSIGWNANIAYNQANSAYSFSNTGYTQANNAGSFANSAYIKANSAGSFANGAFARANSSYDFANTGYTQANNAGSFANGAFTKANSAASFANGAFVTANSAASFANGAFYWANSAYNYANTLALSNISTIVFNRANSAYDHANGAFNRANAAFQQANNSFNVTNVSFGAANSAASFANGAFTKANTSVIKTGDGITGVITSPTAANGTSNTMIATTQFVNNQLTLYATGLGINQTWQNLTNSRAYGTTYTNSTGKPIMVNVRGTETHTAAEHDEFYALRGFVNNVEICFGMYFVSVLVPNGATYKVTAENWSASADGDWGKYWMELR
jgi:hypothetical protein